MWRLVLGWGLVGLLACGRSELVVGPPVDEGGPSGAPPPPPAVGGGGNDGGAGGAGGAEDPPDGGNGGVAGAPEGGAPPSPVVAYANSYDSLYAIGDDGGSTALGILEGCGNTITDIALTTEGELFVSTDDAIFVTDVTTLACQPLAQEPNTYPNSLAVLPPGLLSNGEALVGYRDRTYVVLDQITGAVTVQGELSPSGLISSGDLVWFGGRLLLSVTGPGCSDCIVEVDPVTGVDLAVLVALDTPSVFGLTTWEDALYAFTGSGELRRIDGADGTTTLLASASEPWLGATAPP